MTDGVVAFDMEGRIVLFNPQAKQLLDGCANVEKGELLEHCIYLSQLNSLYKDILETKELTEGKITVGKKTIAARLSPLFEMNSSELIGVIAVLQDITQEEKLEEMRREFIANVSHELRTPISLISGYAEAIIDGVADKPEQQNSFSKVILDEANRLKRLVEDLLELSRLQSGSIHLEKEWVDIGQVAGGIKDKFSNLFRENKTEFQVEINPAADVIWADRFRFEQILINLVSNAIRYAQGGVIKLRTENGEDATIVSISDTGKGISAQDLLLYLNGFSGLTNRATGKAGEPVWGLPLLKPG